MLHSFRLLAVASMGVLAHVGSFAQTVNPVTPKVLSELRKEKSLVIRDLEASGRLSTFELSKFDQPKLAQLEALRSTSIKKLTDAGAVPKFEDFTISIYDDKDLAKAKYELWKRSLVPDPILLNQLRRDSKPTTFKKYSKTEFTELFREVMKNQDVFMINSGTPVLSPLNSGSGGGSVSARPSTTTLRVNDLWNGRLNETFNPEGFLEVVALVNDSAGGSTCTGTLIGPDLVLTAAHCVEEGDNVTAVVHFEDVTQRQRCEAAMSRKEYIRCTRLELQDIKNAKVKRHPRYKPGDRDNDIALLTFPTSFSDRRFARVNVANVFSLVTLAGYGRTDLPKSVDDLNQQNYLIEVGWHKGHAIPSGTVVSWYVSGIGDMQSGACEGDSGGPVYAGRWRGNEPRPKFPELIGVVQGGIQSCSDYDSYQNAVANESIKTWLCAELRNHGAPACITAVSLFEVGTRESLPVAR